MMQSLLTLCVRQEQCTHLLASLSTYRSYLWQCVLPTPERNQTIRDVLALHRHLEQEQEPGEAGSILFIVNAEQRHLLQQVLRDLVQVYGRAAPSEQRMQILGEVACLRVLVERIGRAPQAR